ncbi:hypothetical protein, partial [Klebsiella pneumoniae]|uniref:hypothetical protein n=1 Tax=Klebsiella pneumoniae TaxID=573 RepID=UPI00132FC258
RLTESLGAALRKLPLTDAQKALIPTEASTLHRLLGAQQTMQRAGLGGNQRFLRVGQRQFSQRRAQRFGQT